MSRTGDKAPIDRPLWLLELGLEPYQLAWELQHSLVEARRVNRVPDLLVLLEHYPVITLGRRADAGNILASEALLNAAGIEVHRVERGGDVTYHGPGQLVGYPILRIASYGLGASDYMHLLEESLLRTLAEFGLEAKRRTGVIGLWVGRNKIAALGARIQSGITYHGFALNVNPLMEHFNLIVPCGITDGGVTSMSRELGYDPPLSEVRSSAAHHLAEALGARLRPVELQEIEVLSTTHKPAEPEALRASVVT